MDNYYSYLREVLRIKDEDTLSKVTKFIESNLNNIKYDGFKELFNENLTSFDYFLTALECIDFYYHLNNKNNQYYINNTIQVSILLRLSALFETEFNYIHKKNATFEKNYERYDDQFNNDFFINSKMSIDKCLDEIIKTYTELDNNKKNVNEEMIDYKHFKIFKILYYIFNGHDCLDLYSELLYIQIEKSTYFESLNKNIFDLAFINGSIDDNHFNLYNLLLEIKDKVDSYFPKKKKAKGRCFAIAQCGNSIYWAISGFINDYLPKDDKFLFSNTFIKKDFIDTINSLLPKNSIVVHLSNEMKRYVYLNTKKRLKRPMTLLETVNRSTIYKNCPEDIGLKKFGNIRRSFSCCERKILTELDSNTFPVVFYILFEPCFHCKLVLNGCRVFYIKEDKSKK